MTDILIMFLCTMGAAFILIASFGVYKMPDFYARLSVTIKAATLGIGCILIAASLHFSDFSVTTKAFAIILFLMLTSPVAGFLIGKVDRKSTRLNSSHVRISYAVFCLNKNK